MLAALNMKKRWQDVRRAAGKSTDRPNIVLGYNCQVTLSIKFDCIIVQQHQINCAISRHFAGKGNSAGCCPSANYYHLHIMKRLAEHAQCCLLMRLGDMSSLSIKMSLRMC